MTTDMMCHKCDGCQTKSLIPDRRNTGKISSNSPRAKVAQMIDVYLETARVLRQFKFSLNKNIVTKIEFMEDQMLRGMRD